MLRRVFCKLILVAVVVFSLLALSSALLAQGRSEIGLARAIEVQEAHTARLLAMEGVEGTAIGLDDNSRLAVKVFTDGPGVAGIPKNLDGIPVKVVVTGKFYALPKPDKPPGKPDKPPGKPDKPPKEEIDPTARFESPVPIGVSTGNENECSAGTIACRVTDGTYVYALSNNHVYALENQANEFVSNKVLQPGLYDTGCVYNSDNVIGTLADYVEILFPEDPAESFENWPHNSVDAAIAIIEGDRELDNATPTDGYGTPKSTTVPAEMYQLVQKYGRTTSLTKGIISDTNYIGKIGYSSGTARFDGQIVIYSQKGPFIKPGDSGSLLVTQDDNSPVGLMFAGNANGKYGIANPIGDVLSAFGVDIDGEE